VFDYRIQWDNIQCRLLSSFGFLKWLMVYVMPLFSLYLSFIITTLTITLENLFAVAPCPHRSLTRQLQKEQKQFRPWVTHCCSFLSILPLLLVSLFTSLSETAVWVSLLTRCALPSYHDTKLCHLVDSSETIFHPICNRYLIVLPFARTPIVSVFQPVTVYPKQLCIFSRAVFS
jgi:hypothetical protein